MKATFFSSVLYKFFAALMVVMLVVTALPVAPAHAADTGLQSPTACTSGTWGTPGNATASDNAYATSNGNNQQLVCTFNIPAIPAGNRINLIEVSIEGFSSGTREDAVDLSWDGGATYTGTDPLTTFGIAETTFTLTGNGTLQQPWTRTWAVGDFTAANFRVRLTSNGGTGTISVDQVQVRVTYDLPPEMNVQGNGISITDGDTTPVGADFTNFGNVPENFFVDRTFTIQNTGSGVLNIGAITFTGGDAGDFSLVTAPLATVAPGGSTTFTVRLTSGGGGTRNTTINIANNDTNETPYNFAVQGTTINAEVNVQGLGVNITDGDGTPSALDCTNFGSVVVFGFIDCTYTIQNLGPAAANVLSVGTVTVGDANAADFSVTVQPTSPVANAGSTTFTVRFTPSATGARNATLSFINNDGGTESPYNWNIQGTGLANTAPTITSNGGGATANINVAENTTAVTTVTATDPNVPPQTLTYSIAGTDAGDFSIVPATGVLTFSPAPDFETPTDADINSSYIVIVQVSDGVGTDTQTLTVNVTDVNETPTDIALSASSINENMAANSTVGILSSTDQDTGNTFIYTLVAGTGDTDNTSFNISGISLRITSSPDFETQNSYSVRIRTTDQGGLSYEEAFTIIINNLNETPTDIALSASSINENVVANSTVGTLSSIDPDAGNTFTYTLAAGTGDTDNASFNISGSDLRITNSPDFETQNGYSIRIRTADQGGLFYEEVFTITVTNTNETPTDIALSATSIAENNAVNAVIGALSTTDPDTGNTFTYSLACTVPGTDDGTFNISGADLRAGVAFDFETQNSFSICVRTTDQGGLFFDENFTVTTTDVDEIPPLTAIDSATPSTSPTNSTTLDFTFSSNEVGSTFQCRLDAGAYASCSTPVNLAGLSDGSHTFEVYATDTAGNDDPTPASYTWTVDATAPDTSIDTAPSNPSNDGTPTFTFSSPDATATFQCSIDAGAFSACTAPNTLAALTDGSHTFQVRAIDAVGNTDPTPAAFTWVVDTTAPGTTIDSSPLDPDNGSTPTFTFSGDDGSGSGIASFECQIDAGGFSACSTPITLASLADGLHTFDVRAVDNVANMDATPASFTWTVDTASPDTSITANPTDPSADNTPDFSFTGDDGAGTGIASFECQVDGGGYSACTSGSTFGPLADGSHAFEVRALDNAGNVDASAATYTWTVDATAPETTIDSHPVGPDNDITPAFTFSSTDATATFECQVDGGGFSACNSGDSFGPLGDGSHAFDVRAVDALGNTDPTPDSFTWTLDTGAPNTNIDSNPTDPSNIASAAFTFSSPDADVVGFECQLDGSGFAACTTPQNYAGLSAGSHVFEVRAVDNAANVDLSPASFTWMVDLGFPTVLYNANTVPANNATMTTGPTQITIAFSENVKNDGSAGAANNTANYLLVEDGVNNTFDTVSCVAGLVADDTQITINSAPYTNNGGSGPFVATLAINSGVSLPVGTYRLFVCGTTSIEDLASNELNNGASDALVNFTVVPVQQGGGGSGGSNPQASSLIPATGFPQNNITTLPFQPADKMYAATDLWLEIPKLGVKMSIVGVPQTKDGWDVTWLNRDAGWLNGSAYPTWKGNSVITAHVWDALNKPGPFAQLKSLRYGDQVKIHAFGMVYTYEITENILITNTDAKSAFKHNDKSAITLITCEDYKELSNTYSYRRMVRAVLVSVTWDK